MKKQTILTPKFLQVLITTLAIIVSVSLIRVSFPQLKIIQLSTELAGLIGLVGFFTALYQSAAKKKEEEQRQREADLLAKIRDLQDDLASLSVRVDAHINLFGHQGITRDHYDLKERVIRTSVELSLLRDINDLHDKVDRFCKLAD